MNNNPSWPTCKFASYACYLSAQINTGQVFGYSLTNKPTEQTRTTYNQLVVTSYNQQNGTPNPCNLLTA